VGFFILFQSKLIPKFEVDGMWRKISYLGWTNNDNDKNYQGKKLILFNQVLFIGFFATLAQASIVWPFIHEKSLVFLPVAAIILLCLYLNASQKYQAAKVVFTISIYASAILTTLLIGGSTLYHIQAILVFLANLLIFDILKDKWLLIGGIPVVFFCLITGELQLFNVPDFSQHPWTPIARTSNIISLFSLTSLFAIFFIRLNNRSEAQLSKALDKIIKQKARLNASNLSLEEKIKQRTAEVEHKNRTLQEQNKEKEILLKEVHHRVRNNLQIIISLINLQLRQISNKENIASLQEIQGRVEAMSIVHKKMYETSNFKSIKIEDYTKTIINSMLNIHGIKSMDYYLDIDDKIKLELEASIPVGLILNEIISNFFKHVYSKGQEKTFRIEIKINDRQIKLVYTDNGQGFLQDPELLKEKSLGIQLIESLTEQLDGELSLRNDDGAVYEIGFNFYTSA
jgi:two-component sensor histidine kinase